MLLKVCLNGARRRHDHPAVPVSPTELAASATQAVAAGAGAVHVHPRGPDGAESLDAGPIGDAVAAIRAATGAPVGVSTGAWFLPDAADRLRAIENALYRIKKNVYGICLDCEKPVNRARLDADPAVIRCIDCQSRTESAPSAKDVTPSL